MIPGRFRRLPPLSALCSIEAVARLGSVTRAASELHLTQSAVSHNLRTVEESLGFSLFRRDAAGMAALPRGEIMAAAIHDGLSRIADAVAQVRRSDPASSLTVSVLPGFAVKWLFPRLLRFDEAHRDLEVAITTTAHLVDFDTGEADVAIRYGLGHYPGLHVDCLFTETMAPVAAPRLVGSDADRPLRGPADLARHTLLHDDIWPLKPAVPGWRTWLDAAGERTVDAARGRSFTQSNISIQAAIEGLGVALGRSPLVLDDLAASRLVKPFGPDVPTGYAHYFVCPEASLAIPKVRAFRAWLLDEASATRRALGLAEGGTIAASGMERRTARGAPRGDGQGRAQAI